MTSSPKVLVLTVVHHPEDARIRRRQIEALLEAGWQVTYAAPWTDSGLAVPTGIPGLTGIDVRRAVGRRRLAAQRSAREVLRDLGPEQDVILLHDPELLPTTALLDLPPVVWDVHEDTAAAVEVRQWIPRPLRRVAASGLRLLERLAERRVHLFLADHQYAERFRDAHPVVPNATTVPARARRAAVRTPEGRLRVVYLGSITEERGSAEVVELARRLPEDIHVEVMGQAHGVALTQLQQAQEDGVLTWHGFVPNAHAVKMLDGALAGLCLLHDEANFRPSLSTKVVEYLAHGVPAIVTPLPVQVDLIERSGGGVVVPFGGVTETLEVLLDWAASPEVARELGRSGHGYVAREHDWGTAGQAFVARLAEVARSG